MKDVTVVAEKTQDTKQFGKLWAQRVNLPQKEALGLVPALGDFTMRLNLD